jgi:hypothetical protein
LRAARLRRFAVAALCGAAIAAASAGVAPAQDVTLAVDRVFGGGLRFSGRVSSGAANEYVAVLHQRCGSDGVGTSVVGAQTGQGGFWEAMWGGVTAGTFRARWLSNSGRIGTSDPVSHRGPVELSLTRLSGFRQRVGLRSDQDMRGRTIELQRFVAGQWRRVQRARLLPDLGSGGLSSSATFTVRKRGLVLRAYVPAQSAAPCYTASASEQWRSGPAPGARLAGRVIDRTFLCTTAMQGGIRMVSISASSARGPDLIEEGPSFGVSSGFAKPPGFMSASKTSFTLYPDRCTGSGAIVSLEAEKLRAAPPGPFGRSFDCEAPRRVYLRLRAVFFEPASLVDNRESGYRKLLAEGQIAEAAVAVRTLTGRQLLFAGFSGGKARLFTARSCIEDDT